MRWTCPPPYPRDCLLLHRTHYVRSWLPPFPPPSPLTLLCRGIFGRWPTQFSLQLLQQRCKLCRCCICCSWYRGSEASYTADWECVIDRDHSYLWSHVIAEYSLRSDRDQTLIEASPTCTTFSIALDPVCVCVARGTAYSKNYGSIHKRSLLETWHNLQWLRKKWQVKDTSK